MVGNDCVYARALRKFGLTSGRADWALYGVMSGSDSIMELGEETPLWDW